MLWLWHRPVDTVLIGPLAREPPYAMGEALNDKKTKKKIKVIYKCSHHTKGEIR